MIKKIGDYYALIVVDWNYRTLIVVRRGKHWRVPEQSYHSLGQQTISLDIPIQKPIKLNILEGAEGRKGAPQLPGDSNDGKRQYINERDLLFASFRPMTLLEHGIEIVTPIIIIGRDTFILL